MIPVTNRAGSRLAASTAPLTSLHPASPARRSDNVDAELLRNRPMKTWLVFELRSNQLRPETLLANVLPRRGNTLELRHELTDPTESWRPDSNVSSTFGGHLRLLMMWTALRPLPQDGVRVSRKESEMKQIVTIGLDIAKSLVHGVDAAGQVVLRQKLFRSRGWSSLPNCRDAWLVSRRAPRHTIGPAN